MGKKGTKRKTKWRALPLGEEAGGSGNEDDLHDEDQSTTSSVVGGQPASNNYKRQSFYHKMSDKPYRQTRRFTYDKYRSKEPLVKLESKTFDEEEYTKITTPRQDVLFKKGYFAKKRESSVEETAPPTETDGEEPMMDQIIITNGFVDERGHYLVNGNSYEIYDPYSNTVTVVVGPPPYANGVTQPVLAAVSCQPVPLQPADWYPPGADWPSQGSAWTTSYPRNSHPDSVNSPDGPPTFPPPDAQIPNLYNQPAYVVPGYAYGESPHFNGVPLQMNPPTEPQNSEENRLEVKKTRRKSTDSVEEEKTNDVAEEKKPAPETQECPVVTQDAPKIASTPPPQSPSGRKQIEKQSHSTQTNLEAMPPQPGPRPPGKESHSTQTPPEETFQTVGKAQEKSNGNLPDILTSLTPEVTAQAKPAWKLQGTRYNNNYNNNNNNGSNINSNNPVKDSPRKVCQQRTNFAEDRRLNPGKPDSSPIKVSYAKKAMSGLENANPKVVNGTPGKVVNGTPGKVVNGGFKNQTVNVITNGINQVLTTNGANRANNAKQVPGYEEKRNGFVKTAYGRGKTTNDRTVRKFRERKFEVRAYEPEKCEEVASQSEKSSTVSELSSPTELSSGQNTPPEKLIVQKMEDEINKSFEEKLKQNLTKTEEEKEEKKEEKKEEEKEEQKEEEKEEQKEEEKEEQKEEEKEEEKEEKPEAKLKGKKKKNKGKTEGEKPKEPKKGNKKKKKKAQEGAKEKLESDNSSEEIPFLANIHQKDFLFGGWEGLKEGDQDFLSEMNYLFNGDKEILKSLGLNDDRSSYSKLPLHSDLLMMLPNFGWNRPKLKIEDFFAPACFHSDLFIERNITSMKSTKPEEFFASVIDNPIAEKSEKKKETQKKAPKTEEAATNPHKKTAPKTGYKQSREPPAKAEEPKPEKEPKDGKLGIVEAVNTWLQEQSDSEKFIPLESFNNLVAKEENTEEETDQKNGVSNPIHALSLKEDGASVADFQEGSGCIRVANVINDGFIHVSRDFGGEKDSGRMYRSTSWDAKLSEVNIRKHFKFLTDSASFCQDLISDVRNGLPAGTEYATEELCDPKQTVTKYYILAPGGRARNESDSENEVFDALEYKFLTKEGQEGDGKSPDGNGNASITDSGVHSDMESSEDNATEQQKEPPCKLQ